MEDKLMRDYHDRATRGLPLTEVEKTTLDAWYAMQDANEATLLNGAIVTVSADLQAQIDAGLAALTRTAQHIEALSAENKNLRQEIEGLYRQLAQPQTAQST